MPAQLVRINDTREAERAGQVIRAWALRCDGRSLRDIAEELNVCVGTARKYFAEGLAHARALGGAKAAEWRELHIERMEQQISNWSRLAAVPAAEGADRATALIIRAAEFQARLQGLDKAVPDIAQTDEAGGLAEALKSQSFREAVRRMLDAAEAEALAANH